MPPCMHCGEEYAQHEVRGNEVWCRDGKQRFDVVFQVNPEVIDFVRENPGKSGEQLADLWLERLRRRSDP